MTVPARLPIVQAPMAGGPSTPELAAAVTGAGGFGYVAAGYLSPDALRTALDRTRALTAAPVGVNVFVPGRPNADGAAIANYAASLQPEAERLGAPLGEPRWEDDAYPAKLDLLARAGVHTVSFTFGCPTADVVARLHSAGVRVAVTVTSADEATTAAAAGADSLVVQGTEAGGHQGTFAGVTPNRASLNEALASVRAVADLPLVATGGIMTAADAVAAMEAGAVAVQIGTALLCTPEAGTSAPYRRALLERRYSETVVTRAFSGRWARGLANRFAVEHADAPAGYPQIHHLTRPLRAAAAQAGDPDVPNLWAGTGWSAITDDDAATIVRRIAAGL
ncbi:MAG: nitronate monooxygenase [Jatrophihabitans sp.]|uniref:nitronate monooxygenase n=1 Tax=Jatrophihabitans sp. TaxID=1932789 RepID=UPI003913BDA2